jgi:tetrapyrrole methylase family protein/MazG family protein
MTDHPTERISSIADAFTALYKLVLYLRGEQGCPWDREQSLRSMHDCLQEETSELGDEIGKHEPGGISEEWGDVLFILLMLAAIGEDEGVFDTEKAMRSIEAKMIRRHPHVFGGGHIRDADDTVVQWKDIKAKEKSKGPPSLMDEMPMFYSSAKRADHVQRAAANVGFDWPDRNGVLDKIDEELAELRIALAGGKKTDVATELGDLLFSCVNLARFEGMDAESLLGKTVDKFIERFKYVESGLRRLGRSPAESTLEEMDELWEQSKSARGRTDAPEPGRDRSDTPRILPENGENDD